MSPASDLARRDPTGQPPELARSLRLARLLDSRYRVPGTGFRVGLDGLLGLIPGVGDLLTTGLGAWILVDAHRLGVGRGTLARMAGNLGVDFLVGTIPLVGDLFDFAFKANTRNARLLERELEGRTSRVIDAD